jgi:serine protease Do
MSSVFREVVKKVEPAVVNITTETNVEPPRGRRPRTPEAPDPFRDFFDRFFDFGPPERFRQRSGGSGMITDPSGYILTNYHVVGEADKIKVDIPGDSKSHTATLVGYDRETDVAVLKIDAGRRLPAITMGNSDAAQVGDWVLAIGSPFGLEATVTAGIVSFKGRPGMEQFQRFIQTDASINHGNSGGPLVNLAGEVIGINTAIASNTGASAGIGFALPSNTAVEVYNEIIKTGRVVRGSIGIEFRTATSENEAILRTFGAEHGVVVDNVRPDSPADKAGLRRGDVITKVNGTPIRTGDDLVNKIAATPVGTRVKLTYVRDKKEAETTAAVEDRSKVFADLFGEPGRGAPGEEEASGQLGLSLEEVGPGMGRRYGLEEEDQGLLVREVEPQSFAEEIGVLRGDVILELNREAVRTLGEFRQVERRLRPGSDVVFWLKRYTGQRWVSLYLGGTLPE